MPSVDLELERVWTGICSAKGTKSSPPSVFRLSDRFCRHTILATLRFCIASQQSQWLQSRRIPGDAVGAGAFASTLISVAPIVEAGGQSEIKPLCINPVALAKALGVEPLDGPTARRISGKTSGMDGMEIGRHNLHIDQRPQGAATAKVAKEKV